MPSRSLESTLQLLQQGEISFPKLSPVGSNYTFIVDVADGTDECCAVYKPRDGEVPLWDFPDGTLYKREYAAYLLSQILGWDFIPLTIMRDGPYGVGSLQLYIDHDPKVNYFGLRETNGDHLALIACFDLVANNADRKASHCIEDSDGRMWGIDHGLTFHSVIKVRTVIWDYASSPIPEHLQADMAILLEKLGNPDGRVRELMSLITVEELAALVQRITWLLEMKEYPGLRRRRRQ